MIDLGELKLAIRQMTRKQALYRLLRDELGALGYWKERPRGKPDIGHLRGANVPKDW